MSVYVLMLELLWIWIINILHSISGNRNSMSPPQLPSPAAQYFSSSKVGGSPVVRGGIGSPSSPRASPSSKKEDSLYPFNESELNGSSLVRSIADGRSLSLDYDDTSSFSSVIFKILLSFEVNFPFIRLTYACIKGFAEAAADSHPKSAGNSS